MTEAPRQETLDSLSGAWRCMWTQYRRTAFEDLFLVFENGQVDGNGVDPDGAFTYSGSVYSTGTVTLTKVYVLPNIPVPPCMTYIGHWDGQAISGEWIDDQDPQGNHGPFKMWPGKGTAPGSSAEAHCTPEAPLSDLVPVPKQAALPTSAGRKSR